MASLPNLTGPHEPFASQHGDPGIQAAGQTRQGPGEHDLQWETVKLVSQNTANGLISDSIPSAGSRQISHLVLGSSVKYA